jgi:hypothetical protein
MPSLTVNFVLYRIQIVCEVVVIMTHVRFNAQIYPKVAILTVHSAKQKAYYMQ